MVRIEPAVQAASRNQSPMRRIAIGMKRVQRQASTRSRKSAMPARIDE
jgi:hypothetical protein